MAAVSDYELLCELLSSTINSNGYENLHNSFKNICKYTFFYRPKKSDSLMYFRFMFVRTFCKLIIVLMKYLSYHDVKRIVINTVPKIGIIIKEYDPNTDDRDDLKPFKFFKLERACASLIFILFYKLLLQLRDRNLTVYEKNIFLQFTFMIGEICKHVFPSGNLL